MPKTEIIKIDPANIEMEKIKRAAAILKEGGLAAFPTDTVYGLGADCSNEKAVKRVYEIKKRPLSKSLPVQIDKPERLEAFGVEIGEGVKALMDKFWPGPLTLILKGKDGKKTGFRVPANEIARKLLEECRMPLCVPSANFSGNPASNNSSGVIISFDGLIEVIIDASFAGGGVESTVLDVTSAPYVLLREGAIALGELNKELRGGAEIVKAKNALFVCTGNSCRSVMAKGLFEKETAGRSYLTVSSAGTAAISGYSPTKETIEVMREEEIDVSGEKSRHISPSLVNKADLILTMQARHKEYIIDAYPDAKSKVYLLKEYRDTSGRAELEVKDPIGQSIKIYKEVLKEIKTEVVRIKEFV
ncbi:MAG: threonylcarbamoyl-AMP synthase [Candidatus Omnitrophica bacterium]|nr:threonylcarbamoyl-AMP synthase [Candidatus Omnitrophota bacterium]